MSKAATDSWNPIFFTSLTGLEVSQILYSLYLKYTNKFVDLRLDNVIYKKSNFKHYLQLKCN